MEKVYSPILIGEKKHLLGSYPLLSSKEAKQALDAALLAFNHGQGEWPTMSTEERIECFRHFIHAMNEKKTEIVDLIMWEIGKTLPDATKEFDRTLIYIEETISALKSMDRDSSRLQIVSDVIAQIRRSPLGVVLCMGPYNYPLNETFTTLIPALIMGNTVIFKPPKLGVLLHGPLLEAFAKSFPAGVVNVLYGDGPEVVSPLMKSGKLNCLAFIGSSRVASLLKSQHPELHRLRCVLGLEAKNPAIILKDADLELTIKECILGALSFNGQRCTALKILFVDEEIAPAFIKGFTKALDQLKNQIGMPWEKGVSITPLPEPNKTAYLQELLQDALEHGAEVINKEGGGGSFSHTLFYPAALYPVNSDMRLFHEEQFGPIIPIVPFKNVQEVIRTITDSKYGQQAAIFSQNPSAIADLLDPLVNQVCRVNINSQCQRGPDEFPFTGRKDSAEGTLSISDALRVFSIRSLVAAKNNDLNKKIVRTITRDRLSNFLSTDFIL
jgi:glyceraldehyde-3-phosphate dehydrogenase (NADP+)